MAGPIKDRIPPHDDDAERAVIGAVLIDETVMTTVQQYIGPDDFYSPRHRKIYEAILNLSAKGVRPQIRIISGELEKAGKLEEAGGSDYVASLSHVVPSSANAEYYAQVVQNCSIRRNLIRISGEIGSNAFDETIEPKVLLEEIQQKLYLASDPQRVFRYKTAKTVLNNTLPYIEEAYRTKAEITGIPSGFYELDKMTSGFHEAELIIIGARPGRGKTAIALSIAANITIRQNRPAVFFSLEMSDRALMLRLLSAETGINHTSLKVGSWEKADFQKIIDAGDLIHSAPLYIVDMPHMTMLSILAMSRMLKIKENIQIVFIDYISLIAAQDQRQARYEFVSDVSRSLKGLARELGIPVVVLSQIRRELDRENRAPSLADIRESGSIEQDADIVMFLHYDKEKEKAEEQEDKKSVQLKVMKNRSGQMGDINLSFIPRLTKFVPENDNTNYNNRR